MKLAVALERRQQRVNRAFVHADRHLPALEPAQLLHALADFFAQVQHPVGVFEQQHARIRQRSRARAADEQRLAHPFLELADRDADRGLRSVQLFRGARKAPLAHHRLKYLQGRQIHRFLLRARLPYIREIYPTCNHYKLDSLRLSRFTGIMKGAAMDTVQIFDTTLRDGEQSPGFSMNREEKLQLARQIEEARRGHHRSGLPHRLARRSRRHARRSRRNQALPRSGACPRAPGRRRCRAARTRTRRKTPPASFPRHFRPAPEIQAAHHARAGARRKSPKWFASAGSTAKKWNFPPKTPAAPTSIIFARWFWPPWNPARPSSICPTRSAIRRRTNTREMFRKVRARLGAHPERCPERALPRRSGPGCGEFARGN